MIWDMANRRRILNLADPKAFVRNLYDAFRRCRILERDGSSKAAVGWAFYKAMCELFGEDYGQTNPPVVHPPVDGHKETDRIVKAESASKG